jgi:hypothetical protein
LLALGVGIAEDAGEVYDLGICVMIGIDLPDQDFRESASKIAIYYQRKLGEFCG